MNKVFKGTIWKLIQQYGSYAVKFAVQIFLARLLSPSEFGTIAEVLVFISIAETLAISGMGKALIQKKISVDGLDYSTVLVSSLLFSTLLYILLFFLSPAVSAFYEEDILTIVLRIYGISIFLASIQSIQLAYVANNYLFKHSSIFSLISAVVSGAIAIVLAYNGIGIWALVIQSIINSALLITLHQFIIKWKVSFKFSYERFKTLFSFAWKLLVSTLLGTLMENVYNLSIGKYYGDEMLGHYNRGNTYSNIVVGQTRTALTATTLPFFAEHQNDNQKLLDSIRKTTRLSCVVSFPLVSGFMAVATQFVLVFLTEKWLPCVFFLRLECIFYCFLSITTGIKNGFLARGKSWIGMFTESLKLLLLILCILTLNSKGIYVLCIARIIVSVFTLFLNFVFAWKILGYNIWLIIKDITVPFVCSFLMGVAVFLVSFIPINVILVLLIQVALGVGLYGLLALLFMRKDVLWILSQFFIRKKMNSENE